MSLLGVDYGPRKIGLAIAEGKVAVPLRVVRVNSQQSTVNSRKQLREEIRRACEEYDVRTIVVGVPRSRAAVDEFVVWLRRELTIPILTEDERLTTAFAKRLMRGWKGRADDDAIAAALILQSYLERQANENKNNNKNNHVDFRSSS